MSMSPRLLRPLATGFNPKSISGLAAWWDFNDASTVTVNTGISAVLDKSGNGRTLLQSTTNNQPAWTASAINGKYAAVFDGVNDTLSSSFTLSQPVTLFIVAKYDDSTTNASLFDGTTGNTMRVFRAAATQVAAFAGAQLSSSNTTPESWHIWELIYNGASSSIMADGTSLASGNAGTASGNGITLGTFGNGFSSPAKCSMASVVLYSKVCASSERSSVRKWLGRLYNLTVI